MRKIPLFVRRLILFSCLVGALPVLILGYMSNSLFTDKLQEKVNRVSEQSLTQFQLRIEQMLITVDYSMTQFMNSHEIVTAGTKDLVGENFEFFNDMTSLLSGMQSFEMGVNDVVFVNLDKEWIVNNKATIPLSESQDVNRFRNYVDRPESSFWVTSNVGQRDVGATSSSSSSSMVRLVKKFPIFSRKPSIIVEAQIPIVQMQKWLSVTGGDAVNMMIADREGAILAASGTGSSLRDTLPDSWLSAIQEGSESGLLHTDMEGRKVVLIYHKSTYNGWIYASMAYVNVMTRDARTIGWTTFALCMGILLLAAIIAAVLSKNIYSPIRKLYQLSTGESRGEKGSQDELLLIGNRMMYLIRTESELKDRTARQQSQLRDYAVFKLLAGHMKRSDWEELGKYITPLPDQCSLFLLSIQIDSLQRSKYTPHDFDLLLFAVQNIVNELLLVELAFVPTRMERAVIAVLVLKPGETTFKEKASETVSLIQRAVKHYLELSVSIGISNSYYGLSDMVAAYREGIFALKERASFGEGAILFFQDVIPAQANVLRFPDKLERDMMESIENRDGPGAYAVLHELLNEIYRSGSIREIHFGLVRLLIDIMKLAPYQWGHLQGIETRSTFDRLFELEGIEAVEAWFRVSVVEPILKEMSERSEKQVVKITDALLQLIRSEFDTELTLDVCSERLNYHADYLRRVFKKGTGINFSDYLAQYRLSIAKEWLINTDMRIADIAEKLNYYSPQNFIRYFKKMEGITPGQYREQCPIE